MAYFAKITESNEVLTVLNLADTDMQNDDGVETESIGQAYLEKHNNWPAALWIQTSYNTSRNKHKLGGTPFRGNLAVPGGTWDPTNNIFWYPSPNPKWVKDVATASWIPTAGHPSALTDEQKADADNAYMYRWDEPTESWKLLTN